MRKLRSKIVFQKQPNITHHICYISHSFWSHIQPDTYVCYKTQKKMVTNGAPADNRHLVKLASVHVYNIYIISMVFKLINTSTTLYVAAFTVCFFNNTQYRAQCNRKLLYLASIYGNNVFFLYGNNRARELCNKVG